MFNLKNTETLAKELYKSDFRRYSTSSLANINNNNSNIEINIPRENTYISLQTIYISLQFNVTPNVAANTQNAINNAISLGNLGLIALFSEAKLATTSNKRLQKKLKLFM